MKTEDLRALGLSDEQITEVFKLNGQDIEELRKTNELLVGEKAVLSAEKENLETQLTTANGKIEEFSGLDIEQIKTEAAEYKTKYEESKTEYETEISQLKLNHNIDMALSGAKVRNVKAAKALLDLEEIRDSKDVAEAIHSQIEGLRTSDEYLFDSGTTTSNPVGGGDPPAPKDVSEMTYSEMMAYMEANPGAKI